jgi:hypothetical protein
MRTSRAFYRDAILWIARVAFALAALNSAAALLGKWAVNAPALGAKNLGLALFFAFGTGFGLVASFYAAPMFAALAGGAALARHQQAALWFAAAAGISCVPLLVLSVVG